MTDISSTRGKSGHRPQPTLFPPSLSASSTISRPRHRRRHTLGQPAHDLYRPALSTLGLAVARRLGVCFGHKFALLGFPIPVIAFPKENSRLSVDPDHPLLRWHLGHRLGGRCFLGHITNRHHGGELVDR